MSASSPLRFVAFAALAALTTINSAFAGAALPPSDSHSVTLSRTATKSISLTKSPPRSPSSTKSISLSRTATRSPSVTRTPSKSLSPSRTPTKTPTLACIEASLSIYADSTGSCDTLYGHPVTVGSACTLLPDGAHSAQFSYTLDTPPVPQINVWMTANCSGYTSATYVPTGGFGVCQGPTFGSYLSFELNCVRYTGYSASRTPTPSSSPIPTATPPNLRYCTQVTESLYYLQAEYDANSCSGTPDVTHVYDLGCNLPPTADIYTDPTWLDISGGNIVLAYFSSTSQCHGIPYYANSFTGGECGHVFSYGSDVARRVTCTGYDFTAATDTVTVTPTPTVFPTPTAYPGECLFTRITTFFDSPGVPSTSGCDSPAYPASGYVNSGCQPVYTSSGPPGAYTFFGLVNGVPTVYLSFNADCSDPVQGFSADFDTCGTSDDGVPFNMQCISAIPSESTRRRLRYA